MIRKATLEDLSKILILGKEMFSESRYKHLDYDETKIKPWLEKLILSPYGIVFVTDNGVLVGGISDYYFGKDLLAFEYILYVKPECRGTKEGYSLVREYINRAKELGAKDIHIENTTLVDTEKTESFFEQMGFAYIGGNFLMENK